ncbi:serine/threonine-protein kinase [Spirillospora sp. NPDC029432]|uniref:serine/threonine-protein kinase n=1 Tax=Spirillospora sp. NPDC029432 TaxID=3154599 RepID=UPI0034552950
MPTPLRETDPRQLGSYRIVGRLGRGGMGTVYMGEDASGRSVAVKVINADLSDDPAFHERFRREVTAARRVRRFCTAPVLDARLDGEPLYVVTEYVDGPTLDEAVRERGPMHGGSLEGLAVGTATALGAIHGAGIVHRDLKPANVLLSATGPRVIDFGIARALDATDGPTRTGQFVGTPAYMAPEIFRGRELTPAADVFAWGCVIAFAGTGRPPFSDSTVPAVMHRVMSAEPVLDGLDPALRDLVTAALDKDPERRPTAEELLARLTGSGERPTAAAPGAPPTLPAIDPTRHDVRKRRVPRRPLLLAAGAAVLAVVLGGTAVYALTGADGPPENTRSIFADDFSDHASGWTGGTYVPILGYGYKGQAYGLDAEGTRPLHFRLSGVAKERAVDSVTAAVKVTVTEGPGHGMFGLICREQYGSDGASAYRFLVRHDGQGAVVRRATTDRGGKELVRTGGIDGFKKNGNRVQIACEQDGDAVRLRLWVNGEPVADVTDSDRPLPKGNVGLVVAQEIGGAAFRAEFDDFELSEILG